jgi:hypothetical protein
MLALGVSAFETFATPRKQRGTADQARALGLGLRRLGALSRFKMGQ